MAKRASKRGFIGWRCRSEELRRATKKKLFERTANWPTNRLFGFHNGSSTRKREKTVIQSGLLKLQQSRFSPEWNSDWSDTKRRNVYLDYLNIFRDFPSPFSPSPPPLQLFRAILPFAPLEKNGSVVLSPYQTAPSDFAFFGAEFQACPPFRFFQLGVFLSANIRGSKSFLHFCHSCTTTG